MFRIEFLFKWWYFFNDEDIFKYSLKMWKNIEHKYSIITLMTKNILSISASDIDVEQIFNTAHDVCHYYQNYLNSDTIKMIMLMKWYKKLRLWKFEKNSDSFNEKKKTEAETNKVWIDEQSDTMIQEMIEWETKNSDESVLDTDNE